MFENGLPVEKYFDLCANYVLEYDLIRHGGVIPEISSEENKNESNPSFKVNQSQSNNNNNQNISIEDKINQI